MYWDSVMDVNIIAPIYNNLHSIRHCLDFDYQYHHKTKNSLPQPPPPPHIHNRQVRRAKGDIRREKCSYLSIVNSIFFYFRFIDG